MPLAKSKDIGVQILDAGQTGFENQLTTTYSKIQKRLTKRGTVLAQLHKIGEYKEWMDLNDRVPNRKELLEEMEAYYKELLALDGNDF